MEENLASIRSRVKVLKRSPRGSRRLPSFTFWSSWWESPWGGPLLGSTSSTSSTTSARARYCCRWSGGGWFWFTVKLDLKGCLGLAFPHWECQWSCSPSHLDLLKNLHQLTFHFLVKSELKKWDWRSTKKHVLPLSLSQLNTVCWYMSVLVSANRYSWGHLGTKRDFWRWAFLLLQTGRGSVVHCLFHCSEQNAPSA